MFPCFCLISFEAQRWTRFIKEEYPKQLKQWKNLPKNRIDQRGDIFLQLRFLINFATNVKRIKR